MRALWLPQGGRRSRSNECRFGISEPGSNRIARRHMLEIVYPVGRLLRAARALPSGSAARCSVARRRELRHGVAAIDAARLVGTELGAVAWQVESLDALGVIGPPRTGSSGVMCLEVGQGQQELLVAPQDLPARHVDGSLGLERTREVLPRPPLVACYTRADRQPLTLGIGAGHGRLARSGVAAPAHAGAAQAALFAPVDVGAFSLASRGGGRRTRALAGSRRRRATACMATSEAPAASCPSAQVTAPRCPRRAERRVSRSMSTPTAAQIHGARGEPGSSGHPARESSRARTAPASGRATCLREVPAWRIVQRLFHRARMALAGVREGRAAHAPEHGDLVVRRVARLAQPNDPYARPVACPRERLSMWVACIECSRRRIPDLQAC